MIKFLLRFVVAVVAIGTLSSALYLSSVDFVVPDTNSVLVGIVWDKVARLMNLQGFSITISEFAYKELKVAKNESISDNLLDLAVYAIIWMLYRTDQWGR